MADNTVQIKMSIAIQLFTLLLSSNQFVYIITIILFTFFKQSNKRINKNKNGK